MTKSDLKGLRDRLPSNKYEEINSKLESDNKKTYSEGTIRYVLNGNRNNDDILFAAIDVALKFEKYKSQKFKRFKLSCN
jgi:hypothetical protein